ncbi:MAG TPA: D-glycero-beta-D-manno-heptose 1-phosphate adenylyltransferase [Deltaproteobacteria bacterium]|nr:D-glycero-beta-D-manno-heptose 1-phosphate adenylyltransferase [Deltaproteobacteria bacterium]
MGKVISLRALKKELAALRAAGRRVVFTNGCFDIIHAGHVRYLRKARSLGDVLVVGLNSDSSVRAVKGPSRPVVPQAERAEVLAALVPVDYVVIFGEPTPEKLIRAVVPDVLVKGADWKEGEIVGASVVKAAGGRVARVRLLKGRSTTNIIEKVLALGAAAGRGGRKKGCE